MSGAAGARRSIADRPPGGAVRAALRGACPACGAPTLFAGPVRFAERCSACGLDFSRYNVGDGPAALLTLAIGALVLALALTVEFAARPPIWLHALLWVPLTFGAVIGALRITKALLLQLEHRSSAGEGRAEAGPPP